MSRPAPIVHVLIHDHDNVPKIAFRRGTGGAAAAALSAEVSKASRHPTTKSKYALSSHIGAGAKLRPKSKMHEKENEVTQEQDPTPLDATTANRITSTRLTSFQYSTSTAYTAQTRLTELKHTPMGSLPAPSASRSGVARSASRRRAGHPRGAIRPRGVGGDEAIRCSPRQPSARASNSNGTPPLPCAPPLSCAPPLAPCARTRGGDEASRANV